MSWRSGPARVSYDQDGLTGRLVFRDYSRACPSFEAKRLCMHPCAAAIGLTGLSRRHDETIGVYGKELFPSWAQMFFSRRCYCCSRGGGGYFVDRLPKRKYVVVCAKNQFYDRANRTNLTALRNYGTHFGPSAKGPAHNLETFITPNFVLVSL